MSLSLKSRPGRRSVGNTDPAHAFGSEEQLMAEFQRQEYMQPAPRPASVLSGIREKLANVTARPHKTAAPTYSADTYSSQSAPDLGWETAFDPEAAAAQRQAAAAAREHRAATAEERYEAFRSSVYSTPIRPRAEYTDLTGSIAPRANRPSAVYEEISFAPRERRENTYEKPLYEEISFGPKPSQPAEGGPSANGPYPPDEPVYYDEFGQPAGPYDAVPMAPVDTLAQTGDGKYLFWSGTILVGVVLTLFSFIYACTL